MMSSSWQQVDLNRVVHDTLELVNIRSVTGNTREMADRYEQMLRKVGCTVNRYEFIPDNPTLVAVYGEDHGEKSILFNGHMDVVPLAHAEAEVKDGRIYGRGTCDMKGSLASILEVIRVLNETNTVLPAKLIIVANSLHESPGGRGEDLYALTEQIPLKADLAVVMEGASVDCTIAQLGSATFEITIEREGEACHQLYAHPDTPNPITAASEIVLVINKWNQELDKEWIEDIGNASYFIGSLHSGQFYNQLPNRAVLIGVRRYDPLNLYEDVERTMRNGLDELALRLGVQIRLEMLKVRDGYRIDRNSFAVAALRRAVKQVRHIDLPLVGKKLVTDAGILANAMGVPVICCGPDQRTAHGDVEYIEVSELELTVKVYLQLIKEFMEIEADD